MDANRRIKRDRRKVSFELLPYMVERRKIPDRRLGGWDVEDVEVSEKVFCGIFSQFISKK